MITLEFYWSFITVAFFFVMAYFLLVLPIINRIRKMEVTIDDRLRHLEDAIRDKK